MDLLLFSNSTNFGDEYLSFPLAYIHETINELKINSAVFIPYAAASLTYDQYEQKVADKMQSIGLSIKSIHHFNDKQQAIITAQCIIVGGGNTFHLLHELQKHKLLLTIQQRVADGALYIGWSAGSNLACPSIKTTNDMPILEVDNFKALNLIPFQINPHYTEKTIENHGGESRDMRIKEFIAVNNNMFVVGLPEGSLINYINNQAFLLGDKPAKVFHSSLKHPLEVKSGSIIEMPEL